MSNGRKQFDAEGPAQRGPAGGRAVLIAGPTASGKSALAVEIARAANGVVINADSMQVYRELRVLTARPSAAEEAAVPHRLYGHVPGERRYSTGAWLADVTAAIAAAEAEGKLPVIVGGTGLYFNALTEGLAEVPPIPADIRERVLARLAAAGPEALHAVLAQKDPVMAARLEPADRSRVARALEVVEATGRSLADWQAETRPPVLKGTLGRIVLMPERASLYERCDRRFETMVEAGALEEVRALLELGLDPDLPVMKAVGVREFARYLRGDIDLEAAVDRAQRETRRYAKRQMTWFRNQMISWKVVSAQQMESQFREIFPFICDLGLTA